VRRSVARAVKELREAGIRTALFIDPIRDVIVRASALGVEAVELHTGEYANARGDDPKHFELARLQSAARTGVDQGLAVHAGHGLTYRNVIPVAALPDIEELNIGHSIVSRAVLVGMERAVAEMLSLVLTAPDRVAEPGHWVPPRGY
jgi:pyridoxine 5-phosphate synthase